MKKLIIAACCALFATVTQASYLYWQVTADDYGDNVWDAVSSAKITRLADGTSANQYQAYDTFETMYDGELNPQTTLKAPGGAYMVEGTFDTGYTYYIELYNNSGTLVSRSAGTSGNELVTSYTQSEYVNVSSVLNPGSTVPVWHGGGSYTAVPEPTSAILMLFGAAMLGLKRKNRSIA